MVFEKKKKFCFRNTYILPFLMCVHLYFRYHFETETWELIPEQEDSEWPHPRYGHSAVIYNVSLDVLLIRDSIIPMSCISEYHDSVWGLIATLGAYQ